MEYAFGKLPPKQDPRTFQFAALMPVELPVPPIAFDPSPVIQRWPIYGNDKYGCCTISAAGHMEQLWTAMVGTPKTPPDKPLLTAYLKLGGGKDEGLYMLDVLNHWRKKGLANYQIQAYAQLNPRNKQEVKCAIALFGGVYVGFRVNSMTIADFNAGRIWRENGGTELSSGHAVNIVGYDDVSVKLVTWGKKFGATWGWFGQYVDEAYAIFPSAWNRRDPVPGLNRDALLELLKAL